MNTVTEIAAPIVCVLPLLLLLLIELAAQPATDTEEEQ